MLVELGLSERGAVEAVNKLENDVVLNTRNGSWGIFQVQLTANQCVGILEYPQRQLGDFSSLASDAKAGVLDFLDFSNGRSIGSAL